MHRKLITALLAACVLSGCGRLREAAADHYLSRAEKIAAFPNPSQERLEAAYAALDKSLKYRPGTRRLLETLSALTKKAYAAGFSGGVDLEIGVLRNVLAADPRNWAAFAALVNDLAARGDLYSLNELAVRVEASDPRRDAPDSYEAYAALALCYASMAPWVESEGYLSLNKSPDALVEKTAEAARVRRLAGEFQAALARVDEVVPARRKLASETLLSAAEVALADLDAGKAEAARVAAAAARMESEPAFLKAVKLTVQGNAALMKKDYSGARAFYQSARQNYPGFIDARKQLMEVDFQEGAALALTDAGLKAGRQLLYRAYEESDEIIEQALEKPNFMPFMTRDKFLADTYSVRAGVISAVNAIEKGKLKNKAKLEGEFKAALEEAVRLNPQGKLARGLLERYSRDGF